MADRIVNGVQIYLDSAGVPRERPLNPEVSNLREQLAAKADASALSDIAKSVPKPADTMPMAEKTGAALGDQVERYALSVHAAAALRSARQVLQ